MSCKVGIAFGGARCIAHLGVYQRLLNRAGTLQKYVLTLRTARTGQFI